MRPVFAELADVLRHHLRPRRGVADHGGGPRSLAAGHGTNIQRNGREGHTASPPARPALTRTHIPSKPDGPGTTGSQTHRGVSTAMSTTENTQQGPGAAEGARHRGRRVRPAGPGAVHPAHAAAPAVRPGRRAGLRLAHPAARRARGEEAPPLAVDRRLRGRRLRDRRCRLRRARQPGARSGARGARRSGTGSRARPGSRARGQRAALRADPHLREWREDDRQRAQHVQAQQAQRPEPTCRPPTCDSRSPSRTARRSPTARPWPTRPRRAASRKALRSSIPRRVSGAAPSTTVLPGKKVKYDVAFGVANPADLVVEASPGFEYSDTIWSSGA